MPVTSFSPLLGLALPTTGDLSGTWGTTVNDSITSLLDTAVAGTTTLSTDGDVTLSTTNGAANQARSAVLLCSGARTALRTITAPAQSKAYVVINQTTGGFGVKVVGAGPTTGVTIANGDKALIAWNGSDFTVISSTSITNLTGTLPTANGGTGLTGFTAGNNALYSTSSSALTAGTLPILAGGTGATTNSGARTNLGATTVGSNFFTLANPSAITFPRVNADNTVSTLDAASFRTAIGATTVGGSMFTLTNPSAVTFPRFNADNTVSALDAATFRSAIGAGSGSGTVTSVTVSAGTGLSGGGTVTTSGTITLNNAGVTSLAAGSGISVSGSTGGVTVTNSGVTSLAAGTGISLSGSTGGVTITSTGGGAWTWISRNVLSNATTTDLSVPTGYDNVVFMISELRSNNYTQPMGGIIRPFVGGVLQNSTGLGGMYIVPTTTSAGSTVTAFGRAPSTNYWNIWYESGSNGGMIPQNSTNGRPFAGGIFWIPNANTASSNYGPGIYAQYWGGGGTTGGAGWFQSFLAGRITAIRFEFSGSGGSGTFSVDAVINIYGIKNS